MSGLVRRGTSNAGGNVEGAGPFPRASISVTNASSGQSAQYPFRARTRTPGRVTRTCTSRNFPSSTCVERYVRR